MPGCPEEGCCVPDDSPLQVLSLSDPTQPSQNPDSMQADHSLTEAVHMEGELTAGTFSYFMYYNKGQKYLQETVKLNQI